MTTFLPGLPQPGEYLPVYAPYIAKAQSFADPVEKLNDQRDEVLRVLQPLGAAKRLYRYAPGKWSVQEMLGHIIDAERVFSYRAMRIGRGDHTPLAGFDENAYAVAAETESCGWDELLAEFEHVRHSTALLLRRLPESAWTRTGTSNGAPVSVRALAYIMIGHVAHHLGILHERYL